MNTFILELIRMYTIGAKEMQVFSAIRLTADEKKSKSEAFYELSTFSKNLNHLVWFILFFVFS